MLVIDRIRVCFIVISFLISFLLDARSFIALIMSTKFNMGAMDYWFN
jgi:hypothetical protein